MPLRTMLSISVVIAVGLAFFTNCRRDSSSGSVDRGKIPADWTGENDWQGNVFQLEELNP